jgi:hypothetical protein
MFSWVASLAEFDPPRLETASTIYKIEIINAVRFLFLSPPCSACSTTRWRSL